MKKNKIIAVALVFFIIIMLLQGCTQKNENEIKENEKKETEKKSEISRVYEIAQQNFIEIDINKLE